MPKHNSKNLSPWAQMYENSFCIPINIPKVTSPIAMKTYSVHIMVTYNKSIKFELN